MRCNKIQNILILIVSFVISIFGIFSIMLGNFSQKNNLYTFTLREYDKKDQLLIKNAYVGDSIYNIQAFESEKMEYDSHEQYVICNNKCTNDSSVLEIKTSAVDDLRIMFFNQNKSSYKIEVYKNNDYFKTINVDSNSNEIEFSDSTRTLSILLNIVRSISFKTLLIYLIIMILLFFINIYFIRYILKYINNIRNNKFNVKEFILSAIFLFFLSILYVYLLLQFIGWLAILPTIIFLVLSIIFVSKNKKVDISNYFALIIIFMGILYILCIPPLHVPDETSHFIKSYQMSFVFQNNHETKDKYGKKGYAYLPEDFRDFIIKYGSHTTNSEYKLNARTYFYDLFKVTKYDDLSNKKVWYGTKYLSPIPYLPGTLISLIARITSMPILLLYLLGKLFTFIIGTIMCYYAIKITPYFKKIFFIVPLLPIYFQESSGFCMDWLTNSTSILLLSYILKYVFTKKTINKEIYIKILLLCILLGLCKFGYFPLIFLLLLIPIKKFQCKNKNISITRMIFIILFSIAISVGVYILLNKLAYVPNVPPLRDTMPYSTLFSEPLKIVSMVFETFVMRLDLDFFRGLVDGFGWSTVWMSPLTLFICVFIFMIILLCKDDNNTKLTKKQFIVMFFVFVILCAIIYAAMLFSWTLKGSTFIDGLQPRYFIPPLVLLYILLQSEYVNIKLKNRNVFYSVSIIIINSLALLTIICGFFA